MEQTSLSDVYIFDVRVKNSRIFNKFVFDIITISSSSIKKKRNYKKKKKDKEIDGKLARSIIIPSIDFDVSSIPRFLNTNRRTSVTLSPR